MNDNCTRVGAGRIARQIQNYWADRGYHVETRLVQKEFLPELRIARTDVRSDMKNGYPTKTKR